MLIFNPFYCLQLKKYQDHVFGSYGCKLIRIDKRYSKICKIYFENKLFSDIMIEVKFFRK